MADRLYLSLWFPNFRLPALAPAIVSVLKQFSGAGTPLRLRAAAANAPVPTEVFRYPEAGHGFHCNDRPEHFSPEAAADAWQRTLDWFDRYVSA